MFIQGLFLQKYVLMLRKRKALLVVEIIAVLAILFYILTFHAMTVEEVSTAENNTLEENEVVSFDMDQNMTQTETYIDSNGEVETATIESVITPSLLRTAIGNGTREYKITYQDKVTKTLFHIKCKKSKINRLGSIHIWFEI